MFEKYSVQELISVWNAYCLQENAEGYIYDYKMLSSISGKCSYPVVIIARVGCEQYELAELFFKYDRERKVYISFTTVSIKREIDITKLKKWVLNQRYGV